MANGVITVGRKRRWKLLNYTPNKWALEHVLTRPEPFIIGTTGRQVGKTETAAELIDDGMNTPPDEGDRTGDPVPFVGVLGSNYEKAEISVSRYIENITKVFGKDAYRLNQNKHELTIRDPLAGIPGAKLKWLSAEEAYNTVGFTFSRFIVDEAQAVPDDVWFKFIPTQAVRNASGVIFGTPDVTLYQTWFQGLYLRGQDPLDISYYSFSIASWDAPWMPMERILEAKAQLPESQFRRLYGGEWLEEQGLVFTNVAAAFLDTVPEYSSNRRYVMAVDLAITDDFNVVMVGDPATRTVIYKERWNNADPLVTYDRIQDIWERFGKPKVYPDETGLGGKAMVSELRRRGMRCYGHIFSTYNKVDLVQQLAMDIQHRRIMFPQWEDLLREFRAFIYSRTPSGRLTASAIIGAHDDMVMTLVLLNQAFRSSGEDSGTFRTNYLTSSNPLERLLLNAR